MGLLLIIISLAFVSISQLFMFQQAARLTRNFYGLRDDYKVIPLIIRRIAASLLDKLLFPPIVVVRNTKTLPKEHWAYWLGGPARLIIYDGVALYLEKGGAFSRVIGPGLPMPVLEKAETIKSVVDLRPYAVSKKNVKTWTKDGIEVQFSIRIDIQVASSDEARRQSVVLKQGDGAKNLRFPFDGHAIKRLVENTVVQYDSKTKDISERVWEDSAAGITIGLLKAYISGNSIDELLIYNKYSPQLSSFSVSEELFTRINKQLDKLGIQVLTLQIKDFLPVDQEVTEELLNYWRAEKQKENIARKGESDAESIRAKQRAQTVAQQDLLNSLIENLNEINADIEAGIDTSRFSEASILLLTQIIDKSISDPVIGTYLAKEVLETLEILREQLGI